MKSCAKHGYIDTSPDARECPVCRVWGDKEAFDIPEPTAEELRHALRERVASLEAENARLRREHDATISCLASCERERNALRAAAKRVIWAEDRYGKAHDSIDALRAVVDAQSTEKG